MLKTQHLVSFHPLEEALERKYEFLSYQAAEYLLRYALNNINSITKFMGQDFNAKTDPIKLLNYLEDFKREYGQDWGKQPFDRSGVSAEKMTSRNSLEQALEIITHELTPYTNESEEVAQLQIKIAETVKRMKSKLNKELSVIEKLYKRQDFWHQQKTMYLAASKVFCELLFPKISNINIFMKLKNDLYFDDPSISIPALNRQIEIYLKETDIRNKMEDFIKLHNCKDIVLYEILNEERKRKRKAA